MLAALSVKEHADHALQIALVHLIFNITGIVLFYPIPITRIPISMARKLGEVTAQADRPGYDPISSTLWRQREEYCARMIQTVWRKNYKQSDDHLPAPVGPILTRGLLPLPDPAALLLGRSTFHPGAGAL